MREEMTYEEFLDKLAGPDPTPGGGGASALAGALGAALGQMVGALTVNKKKYADVAPELRRFMEQSRALQEEFCRLIETDAEAFRPLSRAYGMPADTMAERAEKEAVMETCLSDAAAAPMAIMETCAKMLDLLAEFAAKGSPLMISDAATGAALCAGALRGAAVNVRVNTRLMKNKDQAGALDERSQALQDKYLPLAAQIYDDVMARLR